MRNEEGVKQLCQAALDLSEGLVQGHIDTPTYVDAMAALREVIATVGDQYSEYTIPGVAGVASGSEIHGTSGISDLHGSWIVADNGEDRDKDEDGNEVQSA